jgi:hypothetical protein
MATDYVCPYCNEVAIRLTDKEAAEGMKVACRECGKESRLALLPQPTASNLDTRVWALIQSGE